MVKSCLQSHQNHTRNNIRQLLLIFIARCSQLGFFFLMRPHFQTMIYYLNMLGKVPVLISLCADEKGFLCQGISPGCPNYSHMGPHQPPPHKCTVYLSTEYTWMQMCDSCIHIRADRDEGLCTKTEIKTP